MDKPSNEEIVDLLKAAKDCLWDGINTTYLAKSSYSLSPYVCLAITKARKIQGLSEYVEDYLISYIEGLLGNYSTVTEWLYKVHAIPYEDLSIKRQQAYRLDWINQMIKEFSK